MKEWSELEDRYQTMMTSDPASAQSFRQRMTAKFQSNVQVNSLHFKHVIINFLTEFGAVSPMIVYFSLHLTTKCFIYHDVVRPYAYQAADAHVDPSLHDCRLAETSIRCIDQISRPWKKKV